MKINMAVETGYAQTRLVGFPIVSQIEFLLWELRDQQTETVKLNGGDESSEEAVKIFRVKRFTS